MISLDDRRAAVCLASHEHIALGAPAVYLAGPFVCDYLDVLVMAIGTEKTIVWCEWGATTFAVRPDLLYVSPPTHPTPAAPSSVGE